MIREEPFVYSLELDGSYVPRELTFNFLSSGLTHSLGRRRIVQEGEDRAREASGVFGSDQYAVDPIVDNLRHRGGVEGDHRLAARHLLDDRQPESFPNRGMDADRGKVDYRDQVFLRHARYEPDSSAYPQLLCSLD